LTGTTPEPTAGVPAGNKQACCPLCGCVEAQTLFHGTDRLYATTDKSFCVVQCKDCKLIRLFPLPTPEELRTYYPESYWHGAAIDTADKLATKYREFVLRDHLQFVRRALAESGETGWVLDFGCGGGLFLQNLNSGHPVLGLDFSLGAASVAWRVNRVPAICADLSRPPLLPESCAAVTMFHVLEHIADPAPYLEAAHCVLRPNGRLIVQVPNAACWQFLLFGEAWNGVDIPRHLINFRAEHLDRLLAACGFEVLRHKHFNLRDNPAGLATTIAPWLDPMSRRIRKVPESPSVKLIKDLLYLGLVAASLPFTVLEAACRAGSTIMVEARKKK
jgi:2-polyprenyl-3-methyl-5-hydroxy-6-metoxy-1,4-benzoquinol methylase